MLRVKGLSSHFIITTLVERVINVVLQSLEVFHSLDLPYTVMIKLIVIVCNTYGLYT